MHYILSNILCLYLQEVLLFLKYISSGDVETINNVKKNNNNYAEIIEQIKEQI